MGNKKYYESKPQSTELVEEELKDERYLVLHNDEVHTFDYVIDALIDVCEMEAIQAEQCTYLVHYKGKCDIKKGDYIYLKPYKNGLIDKGLEATID